MVRIGSDTRARISTILEYSVGVLLFVAGISGIILSVEIFVESYYVITRSTDAVMLSGSMDRIVTAIKPLPGLAILMLSLVSIITPLLRLHSRKHTTAMFCVFVFDLLLAVPLATILGPSSLRSAIPQRLPSLDATYFARDGIVGRPLAGQPTAPATVDYVFADGTGTYVQYHINNLPRDGQPFPIVIDDRGQSYEPVVQPEVVTTPHEFMKQLMPWRTPVAATMPSTSSSLKGSPGDMILGASCKAVLIHHRLCAASAIGARQG